MINLFEYYTGGNLTLCLSAVILCHFEIAGPYLIGQDYAI